MRKRGVARANSGERIAQCIGLLCHGIAPVAVPYDSGLRLRGSLLQGAEPPGSGIKIMSKHFTMFDIEFVFSQCRAGNDA